MDRRLLRLARPARLIAQTKTQRAGVSASALCFEVTRTDATPRSFDDGSQTTGFRFSSGSSMMQSKKLPKRLFKNKEVVHAYEHERATKSAVKRMTRDHLDVLQNIEFALVSQARRTRRSTTC